MPSQKTLDRFEEERQATQCRSTPTGHVYPFATVDAPLPTSEWHPTIGKPASGGRVGPVNISLDVGTRVDPTGYRTLRTILDAAFSHAATGKGKERHARDLPFDDQPMLVTARMVGPGFPLGQAIKKSQEAAGMIERGELDAAEAECLGAINYLAGAVAWMRERAAKEVHQ